MNKHVKFRKITYVEPVFTWDRTKRWFVIEGGLIQKSFETEAVANAWNRLNWDTGVVVSLETLRRDYQINPRYDRFWQYDHLP